MLGLHFTCTFICTCVIFMWLADWHISIFVLYVFKFFFIWQDFDQIDFKQEGLVKDNISSATFSHDLELSDLRRAFFFVSFVENFDQKSGFSVYFFISLFFRLLLFSLKNLKGKKKERETEKKKYLFLILCSVLCAQLSRQGVGHRLL